MKKIITRITATIICMFISFAVFAQSEIKPKIDETGKPKEQDKTSVTATDPQIVATAKKFTVDEKPKPIVPGGEFKPMDTNKPMPANNIKTEGTDKDQPVMPVVKKAGPPPVVTEQNSGTSAQDRAKPAPLQVIQVKQQ